MKYLGAWRMVSDSIKIYPCEVSKNRAIIEISPRYIKDGIEFPYGSCSPKMVVPIEDMVAMIENGGGEGSGYPLNRVITIGFNANF